MIDLPFALPSIAEKLIISRDVQVDGDKLKNGIQLFRQWLQCECYLPNEVDDVLIRNFLYGSKGNLETAKSKFEKYIVNRTNLKQIFQDRLVTNDISEPWELHRIVYVAPKLTPQGYRVIFMRMPTADSTHFNCINLYKQILLSLDVHLFTDENAGYEIIYDTENFSMGIMAKLNLSLTVRMIQIMYTILPFRIKGLHIINTTPAMDMVLSMMMKILPKKLSDRIQHRKVEDLTRYIPKECLPNEYGGTAGEYNVVCDRYQHFLTKNLKWIKETEALQLRGEIPANKKQLYSFEDVSMDGSFRKLDID